MLVEPPRQDIEALAESCANYRKQGFECACVEIFRQALSPDKEIREAAQSKVVYIYWRFVAAQVSKQLAGWDAQDVDPVINDALYRFFKGFEWVPISSCAEAHGALKNLLVTHADYAVLDAHRKASRDKRCQKIIADQEDVELKKREEVDPDKFIRELSQSRRRAAVNERLDELFPGPREKAAAIAILYEMKPREVLKEFPGLFKHEQHFKDVRRKVWRIMKNYEVLRQLYDESQGEQ